MYGMDGEGQIESWDIFIYHLVFFSYHVCLVCFLHAEVTGSRQKTENLISRERTYVEGDQLNYFSTTGEEIAVWKLRHRQRGGGGAASLPTGVGTDGGSSHLIWFLDGMCLFCPS